MKKGILTICLVVICVVSFIIFKGDQAPIQNQTIVPTIKQIGFYHYFSGALNGGLVEMIDEVNKGQNQFHVQARGLDHEAFKSMILTTLDKDNPPELFSYWAGARVQALVDLNKLAHIDDLWDKERLNERFSPPIVEAACTYNGQKYLLPIDQHLVVFFYNTHVFKENNLKPPDSWDAFLTVCEQLKQSKIIPLSLGAKERWPAQFWMDYLLLRTQGIEYRTRLMTGNARYTDPQVKKVYQIWADLLQKGYFNQDANDLDWTGATQMVCKKQAAMTLMGSWAIPLLQNSKECLEEGKNFDFFAFPVMDKQILKVALGPIDGIVLSRQSANHEFSKLTLAHFAGQESQQKMSLGSGGFAPSLEVPLSFYSPFKERLKQEINLSMAWAFNYDLATPPRVAELGMNSFQELIAFPDQYEKILENVDLEARIIFDQIQNEQKNKNVKE
ncbi:MAG: extracellular solute-binding protein [Pseudomonadota bacterium]